MTANVLLFDLETSPNLGYVWGKWDQNVIKFASEWDLLCVGYKWLGERTTCVEDRRGDQTDERITRYLWDLFDVSDVVIAHNALKFDVPKSRTRFAFYGLPQPSPYKIVDTLVEARKQFSLNSNTLDDVARYFGVGKKGSAGGFDTWLGCMRGDERSWNRMTRYCAQDVRVLESVYKLLLPGMAHPPNLALISNRPDACPKCLVEGEMIVRGYRYYQVTKRVSYQCKACGGYSYGRKLEKTSVERVV